MKKVTKEKAEKKALLNKKDKNKKVDDFMTPELQADTDWVVNDINSVSGLFKPKRKNIKKTVLEIAGRLRFDIDHIEHHRYRVHRHLYAASFVVELSPTTDTYIIKFDGLAVEGKEVDFIIDEVVELGNTILAELNDLTI